MAEPGDRTPEQDDAARVADTRRAMEAGLPPARGTTAPGHGRIADDGQTGERGFDGIRNLDDQRKLQAAAADGADAGGADAGGGAAGGATAAGGGAGAGAAASGKAAAGPPIGEAFKQVEKAIAKAQATNDAHTAEEIWKASGPSTQGAAPEHRRRPGQGRPPGQQSDRSGPANRGPKR
ncbi:hypothetical protein [Kribbella sp. DT2]|uniref:hypothetical protein n=1 Tax=Kribbella sp. DT2 TaxID=3393427 RepID=UPI003CE76480